MDRVRWRNLRQRSRYMIFSAERGTRHSYIHGYINRYFPTCTLREILSFDFRCFQSSITFVRLRATEAVKQNAILNSKYSDNIRSSHTCSNTG